MTGAPPVSEAPPASGQPGLGEPADGLGPWRQFLCRACGLIYDEAEGDPDGGLAPGTRFEAIPDDWVCPVCGVGKADFEPYVRRARAPVSAPAVAASRRPGLVIVGAGIAGWGVAEAVRALDGDVPVTLVTACDGARYHKPELSVALSRGLSADGLRRETGLAAAARLGVRLMARTVAVGLSTPSRRLRTTRGTLPYTGLALALGARPAQAPGLPPDLCWRINDLGAWDGLHRALAGGPRRVAVVGAGLVGCELAEDLSRAGHAVTLLGLAALPLAELLPAPAGRRVAAGLSGLGITVRGEASVAGLSRLPSGAVGLALASGEAIEADVVVSATGLATDARLARAAGLAFDRGIAVDPAALAASAPGVYALGDCISLAGVPCRYVEPVALQAEVVAHGLLGLPHPGYRHAQPVVRLKTRSAPVVLHGLPRADAAWRVIEDGPDRLVMEQWRDGELGARLVA